MLEDSTPELRQDQYTAYVARVMKIDDITWGQANQNFLVRYRGQLYDSESGSTYDQLADLLRPNNITLLFRIEGKQHVVILVPGVIRPKPSKVWVNGVLFILTLFSVMLTGALYSYNGPVPESAGDFYRSLFTTLGNGIPFAISLLAILVAHEFGHYLAGRYHHSAVTLPYFIPFPLSYFGTMGAFIQMKEPPKNKRILLDIGIAGPIAGLVIAIPILILGLALSPVENIPFRLPQGQIFEGNSLLYLFLKYLVHGELLPQPIAYGSENPILYWIRYFFTGLPLPTGGQDVSLHPIAWAGWAGLLVTALNLIPAGQLDGGHVMYVLFGRHVSRFLPYILIILALLGMFWSGWWLWAILIFLLGRFHAEPLDQITPLDTPRKFVAILGIIIFIIVFIPVPLVEV
jgi:membrane-associated protease RseP (regulator of RpoE activity)